MKSKSENIARINKMKFFEVGTQTDLIEYAELYSADSLLVIKIDSLFSKMKSFSLKSKKYKLLSEFVLELQNISKLIVQSPLKSIDDELSRALLVVNLLEDLVANYEELDIHLRKILFSTSVRIRECYIKSLQVSQNYNLQRSELVKLLQVYDEYKKHESLAFSQEVQRLIMKNLLNNSFSEDEKQGLFTKLLDNYDILEVSHKTSKGAQTLLSNFLQQQKNIDISHNYDNHLIKEKLKLLNKKYLDKIPDKYEIKLDIKNSYLELSYKSSELLRQAKNNPSISSTQYLSLLDDALEVQHSYISILKQTGFVEHSLYNALQKSAQIFKEYYEIIKNTDLQNEAKDWLLDLMTTIQARASNVTITRACATIMHSECTSEDEKARAQDTIFSIMAFDESRIAKNLNNHSLDVICAILNQAIVKVDWLPAAELKVMTETSALYLIKILDKLYPGTPFANNWIFAIDLTVEQDDLFWGQKEYLGTIFEFEYNVRMLSEAIDLFHRFRACQLQQMQKNNPDLKKNKFLEFQLFAVNFRIEAYKYLLKPVVEDDQIPESYKYSLLNSDYTSQYVKLLTEAKLAKINYLQQKKIVTTPNQEDLQDEVEEMTKPIIVRQTSLKLNETEDNFDVVLEEFNFLKMFSHMSEWDSIKIEVRFLLEKKDWAKALHIVEKFLFEYSQIDLNSDEIKFKNSIFDALSHKFMIHLILNNIDEARSVLTNLSNYLVNHQHTYLRNAQDQQLEIHTAEFYAIERSLFDNNSVEYKTNVLNERQCYLNAHEKAKEIGELCYGYFLSKDLTMQDLLDFYDNFDKLKSKRNIFMNDYQLYSFIKLAGQILQIHIFETRNLIDKEKYTALLKCERYIFNPDNIDGLKNTLQDLEDLKNFCSVDLYCKKFQAKLGLDIYIFLFETVSYELYYKKFLDYHELLIKYAQDDHERSELENLLNTIKTNYEKNIEILLTDEWIERVKNTKNLVLQKESFQVDITNIDEKIKVFYDEIKKGVYFYNFNYIIILLRVFEIKIPTEKSFANLACLVIFLTKHLSQQIDEFYDILCAFFNSENSRKTIEFRERYLKLLDLHENYKSYLTFMSAKYDFQKYLCGDITCTEYIQNKIQVVNNKIKIIKNILKYNDDNYKSLVDLHIEQYVTFDDNLKTIFKNIKSSTAEYNYRIAMILNNLNHITIEAALFLLSALLKDSCYLKIPKSDLVFINLMICSGLKWCRAIISSNEFSHLFLNIAGEDFVNDIPSYFVKEIDKVIKKYGNYAKENVKEINLSKVGLFSSTKQSIDHSKIINEILNKTNNKLVGSAQESEKEDSVNSLYK